MKINDSSLEMAALYKQGWTLKKIGNEFDLTAPGVRDRFLRSGIKPVRRLQFQRINKKRLEKLYQNKSLTIAGIAEALSVSEYTVHASLKFHKIPKRQWKRMGGYLVKFFKKLKPGEQKLYKSLNGKSPYPVMHKYAKRNGIKISVNKCGEGKFIVTRLE